MIGVRADGTKELIALDDGHRESTESSLDLLRGCKRRGMAAQVLAVGDGALGFWFAVREVFPETREQRCWWRTIGNVRPTCSRPTTAPSGPRRPPRSPTTSTCCWPSRTTRRALDPAAHHQPDRVHLRHRQASPASHQGPGSRAAGVAMAFTLIGSAQTRSWAVNAPHLVAVVRAGGIQERQAHRTTRRISGW
jgi:putative transposase